MTSRYTVMSPDTNISSDQSRWITTKTNHLTPDVTLSTWRRKKLCLTLDISSDIVDFFGLTKFTERQRKIISLILADNDVLLSKKDGKWESNGLSS